MVSLSGSLVWTVFFISYLHPVAYTIVWVYMCYCSHWHDQALSKWNYFCVALCFFFFFFDCFPYLVSFASLRHFTNFKKDTIICICRLYAFRKLRTLQLYSMAVLPRGSTYSNVNARFLSSRAFRRSQLARGKGSEKKPGVNGSEVNPESTGSRRTKNSGSSSEKALHQSVKFKKTEKQ